MSLTAWFTGALTAALFVVFGLKIWASSTGRLTANVRICWLMLAVSVGLVAVADVPWQLDAWLLTAVALLLALAILRRWAEAAELAADDRHTEALAEFEDDVR